MSAVSSVDRDALYRKISWRVIPFLLVSYMVCRLDTACFGYAKLQFVDQLGFTEAIYGFGAGLFYLGYSIFEVPSNLYMKRFGIRRLLIRIMVIWGLITAAAMFMKTPMQFYIIRFMLGLAEGGFFPGILLYMTYWFPADKKAKAFSIFLMANPIAGAVGSMLSGWIMRDLAGTFGLAGWQLLFLVLGIPAVVLGLLAWFCLTDEPEKARWLTSEEKALIEAEVDAGHAKTESKRNGLMAALAEPRVYFAAIIYFAVVSSLTMLTVWAPTIVKGLGYKDLAVIGALTSVPYLTGLLGLFVIGRSSDHFMERKFHFTACAVLSGSSLLFLGAVHGNPILGVMLLCTMTFGLFGAFAVFFTMPTAFLSRTAAAAGIALITAVGNLAGFFMPWATGAIRTQTGSLYASISLIGWIMIAGAALVVLTMPGRTPSPSKSLEAAS